MIARENKPSTIPAAQTLDLAGLAEYGEGSVVSRTLIKNDAGTVTLFAFDLGQELSEHTVPFDAFAQILEGEAEFVIGGITCQASVGQAVLMPANIPHSVRARARFKMLLSLIRL